MQVPQLLCSWLGWIWLIVPSRDYLTACGRNTDVWARSLGRQHQTHHRRLSSIKNCLENAQRNENVIVIIQTSFRRYNYVFSTLYVCWIRAIHWVILSPQLNIKSVRYSHYSSDASNHRQLVGLFKSWFMLTTTKTTSPASRAICEGNPPASVNSPHKLPVMNDAFPFG